MFNKSKVDVSFNQYIVQLNWPVDRCPSAKTYHMEVNRAATLYKAKPICFPQKCKHDKATERLFYKQSYINIVTDICLSL